MKKLQFPVRGQKDMDMFMTKEDKSEAVNLDKAAAVISLSGLDNKLKNQVSWKAVCKAARICLTWFMVHDPDKLEEMYFDYIDKGKIKKIGSSESPIITGTSIWKSESIYLAFDEYLLKSKDKECLKMITEKNDKMHAAACKMIPRVKSLNVVEQELFIQDFFCNNMDSSASFVMLELYLNDIQSIYMDKFFSMFESERLIERRHLTEYFYEMDDFSEDPIVLKNVSRLKKIMDDYTLKTYNMSAKEVLACIFCKGYGIGHYFPIKTFNISPDHLAALNALEFGYIMLSPGFNEEYVDHVITSAIQGVCYGYIEAYYEKAYSQKLNDYRYKQPSLLETKSMTIDDKHPLFNCKTTDINRMVRETPASELFLSALWQVQSILAATPNRLEKIDHFQDELANSKNLLEQKNNEIAALCKENETSKATIASLNKKISVQDEKIRNFDKNVAVEKAVSERDETIRQLERSVENLKKELEKEKEKTRKATEEKPINMSPPVTDTNATRKIDVTKKYLFVVCHDLMKTKLQTWFPNSVISEGKDIRPSANYYMTVFITKNLSHSEYNRIKPMCINNHIPMANCNVVNFERICETIRQCEDEYKLI